MRKRLKDSPPFNYAKLVPDFPDFTEELTVALSNSCTLHLNKFANPASSSQIKIRKLISSYIIKHIIEETGSKAYLRDVEHAYSQMEVIIKEYSRREMLKIPKHF